MEQVNYKHGLVAGLNEIDNKTAQKRANRAEGYCLIKKSLGRQYVTNLKHKIKANAKKIIVCTGIAIVIGGGIIPAVAENMEVENIRMTGVAYEEVIPDLGDVTLEVLNSGQGYFVLADGTRVGNYNGVVANDLVNHSKLPSNDDIRTSIRR